MASLISDAIVTAVRPHGEHGCIVRVLTPYEGQIAGYVRGGRSRRLRPILMAGNLVRIDLRTRVEGQLGGMSAELLTSRAPCLQQPLSAAGVDWISALTAASLPEAQPFPSVFAALSATLDVIMVAASARQWAAALARYELLLLAELGFGLNLYSCVVTGSKEALTYVSPKSGGALSQDAATGYEEKLFRLPPFLIGADRDPPMRDILDGLTITGHFLERNILSQKASFLSDVRTRMTERLHRTIA